MGQTSGLRVVVEPFLFGDQSAVEGNTVHIAEQGSPEANRAHALRFLELVALHRHEAASDQQAEPLSA